MAFAHHDRGLGHPASSKPIRGIGLTELGLPAFHKAEAVGAAEISGARERSLTGGDEGLCVRLALGKFQIMVDHDSRQLFEIRRWLPAQLFARL